MAVGFSMPQKGHSIRLDLRPEVRSPHSSTARAVHFTAFNVVREKIHINIAADAPE
jgi:hypothetical protein